MSEGESSDLEPDITALLRREGEHVGMPADAAGRLAKRMAASIGALGPSPGGGSEGSGDGGGNGGGGSGSGGAGGGGAGPPVIAGVKLVPLALAFLVGSGVGGAVVSIASSKPPPTIVYVDRAAALTASAGASAPASAAPSPAPPGTIASMSVDALPSARSATPAALASGAARATSTTPVDAGALPSPNVTNEASSARADDSFVAERQVLDAARVALGRGDVAAASSALDVHVATYPSGRLVEEREALRVRTLAASGRPAEARAAAASFRARWPNSVLLPAVEKAAGP